MLLGDVVEPNHAGPCSTSAAVRRSFVARRAEPIVQRKTGRGTDEAGGPDRSLVSSVAIRPRGAEPSNPENFPPFRPPTKPRSEVGTTSFLEFFTGRRGRAEDFGIGDGVRSGR